MELHDGGVSTTTEVWDMLSASFTGDLNRVKALLDRSPGLLTCMYDYTSPLHLAVREGHVDLVASLVERGALAILIIGRESETEDLRKRDLKAAFNTINSRLRIRSYDALLRTCERIIWSYHIQ